MVPSADLDHIAHIAEHVAVRAGTLVLDGLDRVRTEVSTKSSATDVVTEMDLAAEALIVDAIVAERPDDGVVGEEGAARESRSGVVWLIDPIDGTTNYLYGHPGFGVSVAAEIDGEMAVGVVVDPMRDETFRAIRGQGASRNGRAIGVSNPAGLDVTLVATGFSYDAPRRQRQGRVVAELLGHVRDIRRVGAAAVDLCSVACGRVDAYFERGLSPWDLAAGSLIASEAGAVVSDLDGGDPSPEFTAAFSPSVAPELTRLLRTLGAHTV